MATSSGASGATGASGGVQSTTITGLRWVGDRDGRTLQYHDGTKWTDVPSNTSEVGADPAAAESAKDG